MKKITLITALLLSGFAFQSATAQVRIGLNFNIGQQPIWGPVGYDHVEYYYMPDIDAYYNVPNRQYIYMERGRWRFSTVLPNRFHFDLYSGYKVVVNEPTPYRNAEMYRTKYASYRGNHDQQIIRNSQENKYFENRDHPQHDKWKRDNDNNGNNGNGNNGRGNNGRGRGHNKGRRD